MREIVEDEHRKPAKIYIVKEPKLQENDQLDILPF